MEPPAVPGFVSRPSAHTVDETLGRVEKMLAAKGVKVFALIDHGGEAEKAGLTMRPTKLLIFGNPRAGTPLMVASPSIALDLPLKLLVWEDASGKVWISYNSVEYLRQRHGLPPELAGNIAVIAALADLAGRVKSPASGHGNGGIKINILNEVEQLDAFGHRAAGRPCVR